jgi:hypothetical protein
MALMKLRLSVSFLLVVILLAFTSSAAAQGSYSFSLNQETVNVYWNSDGTMAVDYVFAFANDPGAHVIDFVDVGMPNGDYDYGSISADVGGRPVDISSDYQGQGGYGFAVDMSAYAIPGGQSGTLHVNVGRISNVLYKDTNNPDTYASAVFSPTWFGSQYVHGSTNMTVVFHLPPGVQPDEPRYHDQKVGWSCADQPAAAYDSQNRITYTWQCASADGHTKYTFGASFPNQYVPSDAIVVPPPFDLGGFLAGLAGSMQTVCCIGFFLLMFVGAPVWGAINSRKRKLQYLPPKISIEGHGVKRGLTAVEAAILMEEPLDKVMTMILFGAVKKNAATVLSRDPLKIQLPDPLPGDLHDYETAFLQAMANDNLTARRKGLQEMTVGLVNGVSAKMKGFSRKETVDYYKAIMERAWQQIESAGTPEVKSQMYDESLEWTMLDKNYDERTRRVFTGPVFVPIWWGRYDPGFHPASVAGHTAAPSISTGSSGGRVSLPGSAMAASVIGGVQNFSSRVIGDVQSFTSGVTNRTNPVPVSKSSGGHWSGGGGHSCACACACAGCACACAGGGR